MHRRNSAVLNLEHKTEIDYLSLQTFYRVLIYRYLYLVRNRTLSFSFYRVGFLTELLRNVHEKYTKCAPPRRAGGGQSI